MIASAGGYGDESPRGLLAPSRYNPPRFFRPSVLTAIWSASAAAVS